MEENNEYFTYYGRLEKNKKPTKGVHLFMIDEYLEKEMRKYQEEIKKDYDKKVNDLLELIASLKKFVEQAIRINDLKVPSFETSKKIKNKYKDQ